MYVIIAFMTIDLCFIYIISLSEKQKWLHFHGMDMTIWHKQRYLDERWNQSHPLPNLFSCHHTHIHLAIQATNQTHLSWYPAMKWAVTLLHIRTIANVRHCETMLHISHAFSAAGRFMNSPCGWNYRITQISLTLEKVFYCIFIV